MRIVQVDIREHNLSKYISECAVSHQKVHGKRLSKAVVNSVMLTLILQFSPLLLNTILTDESPPFVADMKYNTGCMYTKQQVLNMEKDITHYYYLEETLYVDCIQSGQGRPLYASYGHYISLCRNPPPSPAAMNKNYVGYY